MRTCTLSCAIIVACATGRSKEPVTPRGALCTKNDPAGSDPARRRRASRCRRCARARKLVLAMNWIGLGVRRADRGDHLVGELAFAGVDHERALIAGLHDDVGAVADEHVDVVADLAARGSRRRAARVRGLAGFRARPAAGESSARLGFRRRAQPAPRTRDTSTPRPPDSPRAEACSASRTRSRTAACRTGSAAHVVRARSRICSPSSHAYSQAPVIDRLP